MSSLGPWHGGGGGGDSWGTPFSSDVWDHGGAMTGGGDGNRNDDVSAALANANVDWSETDRAHIFRADLPGVRTEDLKVQIEDDNVLHISGERVVEEEQGDDKWHMVERRRGSFSRRFRLPENADVDGVKCGLEHGVLTVEVPKKKGEVQAKNVRYVDVA